MSCPSLYLMPKPCFDFTDSGVRSCSGNIESVYLEHGIMYDSVNTIQYATAFLC